MPGQSCIIKDFSTRLFFAMFTYQGFKTTAKGAKVVYHGKQSEVRSIISKDI